MNWKQEWIDEVLENIPAGSYRGRVESELRDHLETQYRVLTEAGRTMEEARAETLEAMGRPDRLREEYRAAWLRSLPGRLEALRCRLKAWAKGFAVMWGVQCLVTLVLSTMWNMALSLPGDSTDKWVRLIRGTVGDLNNSYLRWWLPLVLALAAGAFYLGRKFRTTPRPAPLISVGLWFHWASVAAFNGWWRGMVDHHRPFWEAVGRHFYYMAWHYGWTFALCILLGAVFQSQARLSPDPGEMM